MRPKLETPFAILTMAAALLHFAGETYYHVLYGQPLPSLPRRSYRHWIDAAWIWQLAAPPGHQFSWMGFHAVFELPVLLQPRLSKGGGPAA